MTCRMLVKSSPFEAISVATLEHPYDLLLYSLMAHCRSSWSKTQHVDANTSICSILQHRCVTFSLLQVLIFSEKKAEVDDIHEYLLLKGVQAVAIHVRSNTNILVLCINMLCFRRRIDPSGSTKKVVRMFW